MYYAYHTRALSLYFAQQTLRCNAHHVSEYISVNFYLRLVSVNDTRCGTSKWRERGAKMNRPNDFMVRALRALSDPLANLPIV